LILHHPGSSFGECSRPEAAEDHTIVPGARGGGLKLKR
jgi:hypothetical protein